MIRAVIFDLDGTLIETERLKAESYASAAAQLRPDVSSEFRDGMVLDRRWAVDEPAALPAVVRDRIEAAAVTRPREANSSGPAGPNGRSDPG